MNFLDKFRYTYDDLNELGIVKNNYYNKNPKGHNQRILFTNE